MLKAAEYRRETGLTGSNQPSFWNFKLERLFFLTNYTTTQLFPLNTSAKNVLNVCENAGWAKMKYSNQN